MKRLFAGIFLFVFSLTASPLIATTGTGFVTPTTMSITFTSAALIRADNSQLTLINGTFSHAFNRTDKDFSMASLGGVSVPVGRYIGAQVCYNTSRSVVLNGVKYQGMTSGSVSTGTVLYSSGSSASNAGSITTGAGTGTTLSGYVVGSGTGTGDCSSSYFAAPVCVGTSTTCTTAGDSLLDPSVTPPNLNLLLDMYNSVGIDAGNMSLDNHVPAYPYPTLGTPGAAFHFVSNAAGSYANVSLIFDGNKKGIAAAAYGGGTSGICAGNSFVTVTKAPSGSFLNAYGPSAVMAANTSSGLVQFAAGNATTGNSAVSSGTNTIDNFIRDTGTSPTINCLADSGATPPYLGFTYPSGAGSGPATGAWVLERLVDPANIFGHCASASPGFIGGTSGTCANQSGAGGYF